MKFKNGLTIGAKWCFSNDGPSKHQMILASYHHPKSTTWRWALYYTPKRSFPYIGKFTLLTQPHMFLGRK